MNNRGQTLVESVVAILITSIAVVGIFSVIISASTSVKKTGKKEQAAFYIQQVSDHLKLYVADDRSIPGPGSGGGWTLPEDASKGSGCGPGGKCAAGCWALDPCEHDVTKILPILCDATSPLCSGTPVNATLTYTVRDVTDATCGNPVAPSLPCKSVQFSANWADQ